MSSSKRNRGRGTEGCLPATLLLLATATPGLAAPRFEPVETASRHAYTGGWEHFVGGGVAAFDCDGDALPELFMAGGESPSVLLRNRSDRGGPIRMTEQTPPALRLTGVTGAYPLDIDGDGTLDLAVLRVGPDMLLRGVGACDFEVFDKLGFESGDWWSTAFSATWEAGNALPTLAIGTYVDRADPEGPFRACDAPRLYRPAGARYEPPLALDPGYCALSALFSDWGRLGRQDLRLSNDRHYYVDEGEEQLWAMEDPPRLYAPKDGWRTHRLWGMGIASRDLDGDGVAEVFLTSMADQRLQSLSGPGPAFVDARFDKGATAHVPYEGDDGRPSTGWHAAFGDVDLDGRDDLFIAKGNVEQMPSNAMRDPNNLLMQGDDGRFEEAGGVAGIANWAKSRGAALVDLDGDGRLDLAVVNRGAPFELYRNETETKGHWVALRPVQDGPNRFAVGGWIEIALGERRIWREMTVGGGHAGGVAGPEHVGLGPVATMRVRLHWPDRVTSDWIDLETDRVWALERDGTELRAVPF
jgi:hypothetical protein